MDYQGILNMNPTTMALIMLVLCIAFILWNKISMNFIMFVIPFVCALALGYSLTEVSNAIVAQIANVMGSVGWMLLFGLIYFTMITETGMFDTIINRFVKMVGTKMNVVVVMAMTSIIGAIAYLTANMSTTYLICFPVMLPLFKKFKMDQRIAFILCQVSIAAMCWLPWGIGLVNSAMMAGVSAEELASASIPWGLCHVPAIILLWAYFAMVHKKKHGTLGLPSGVSLDGGTEGAAKEVNPNNRPKLFWFNLIVFVIVVVCLAVFKFPSYLIFIFASIITAMVNYREDFGKIWNKAGMTFFNVLLMLIAICFYLAVFNLTPVGADGAPIASLSMVNSLATTVTSIFPEFLTKYMFVIFLLLVVPIIHFIPYQVYNTMYPLFISIGASFGMGSMAIIAPFVCTLALATSVTPMNSSTYVGCTLCEVEDVNKFCNWGGVIMFFVNLVVCIIAAVTGVLQLG